MKQLQVSPLTGLQMGKKNMFFVIPEMPSKTIVMVLKKKLPDPFKDAVPLVDQDVMNIYANLYPHTFYELGEPYIFLTRDRLKGTERGSVRKRG